MNLEDLPEKLRVKLDSAFNEQIFNKARITCGGMWKNLAENLDCSQQALYQIMRNTIIVKDLIKLCEISEISISDAIDHIEHIKVHSSDIHFKNMFPIKSSPELAELVGYSLGDGTIHKTGMFTYWNNNEFLIQRVIKLVHCIFNYGGTVRKSRNTFYVSFPSLIGEVLIFYGSIRCSKIEQAFPVPSWITKGDCAVKKAFLQALFNDEGFMNAHKTNFNIGIMMCKKKALEESLHRFMDQLRILLKDLGVASRETSYFGEYSNKKGFAIRKGVYITGFANLIKFRDFVGFTHSVKYKKLLSNLELYKNRIKHYQNGQVEMLITGLLMENPSSAVELGSLLNRSANITRFHLRNMYAKGLVDKTRKSYGNCWELKDA